MPGLDKENFDYAKTMAQLWGNSDGDLFYSGKSGFSESNTATLDYSLEADLEYLVGDFDLATGVRANNIISKYSLDDTANNNIWDITAYGEFLWASDNGWEVGTDLYCTFHKGYSGGYNKPEFLWNASVSKEIGQFTLSFMLSDILNQEQSLNHITSSEYKQDTYHNVMGRLFLLGLTWNFGKMGASQKLLTYISTAENAIAALKTLAATEFKF